jgi:hypothetical protein
MCDKRASCGPVASGGVQCACVGKGLRAKAGTPDNGQQCEQDFSMHATLESESVAIAIAKPGSLANRTLTLIVEARGEAELNVTFHVAMTRETSYGATIAVNGSICIDQPSVSAFGLHLVWAQLPPASMWRADLDRSRIEFSDSLRHEFTVRLACDHGEQNCAADGDVITTVVQLVSDGSLSNSLNSEVRVVTQVQSLLSCRHTRATARIEPDSESVPIATQFRVQLCVHDTDNLPVNFTRAEISLGFGGQFIPMQWSRGSNEYVATVPAELTGQPAVYDLVVNASNVWDEAGLAPSCELLRRRIIVKEGFSTAWILVGAAIAAVVVIGGLLFVVRKRNANLQAIMAMLFTEVCAIQYH